MLDIERGKLAKIRQPIWQTDTPVGKKSWGYIRDEENKSPNEIIDELVDIVSKNGCLLPNIGPRAEGTITEALQHILLEIGKQKICFCNPAWLAAGVTVAATRRRVGYFYVSDKAL